jgi:hypothetical protein
MAFKNFWDPMEKSHFQKILGSNGKNSLSKNFGIKKAKKNPNFKIPRNRKKMKKSSSTKFLHPLGESMFKKSAKSEMVTGRLDDYYKKPLLIYPPSWNFSPKSASKVVPESLNCFRNSSFFIFFR